MPKFQVCFTRMTEESTVVEVEAASPEAAAEIAQPDPCIAWEPGEYSTDQRVYAVLDDKGEFLWEPEGLCL